MHRYMMLSAICIRGTVDELETYARSVSEGYRPPIDKKWPDALCSLISVGACAHTHLHGRSCVHACRPKQRWFAVHASELMKH